MNPFWKDHVSSYRTVDVTVGRITKQQEIIQANNIECHYSRGTSKSPVTDGSTKIISEPVLFCASDANIQEGDRLVITQRNGHVINATAGEIMPYSSGLEIRIKRDDTL